MAAPTAHVRVGTVSGYDPGQYAAKVVLQPDGVETGWMPIASVQPGAGWGMQWGPRIGDLVLVLCLEGEIEAGVVWGGLFNDIDRPQAVPAGEMWLTHASGSTLQFHNDGTVALVSAGTLTSTAPQWNHTGNITVTGTLTATTDVIGGGKSLKTHTHSGVTPGGGTTGAPV
jgi:phage baseplate assembly protein V